MGAIAERATELVRLTPAVRRGGPRAVHRLRVTARRLLAALVVLVPPSAERNAMTAGLEALAKAAGAVRDLDVLDAAVRRRGIAAVDPAGHGMARLRKAVAAERDVALGELAAVLASPGWRAVRRRLVAIPAAAAHAEVTRRLASLLRDFRRAGRRAAKRPKPKRLHRVRLRGKQLRYALEISGAGRGPAGRRLLRRLERLQVVLGKGQDARAQIEWLRRRGPYLGSRASAVGDRIARDLTLDLQRTRRDFAGRWQRIDRGRRWRALRREIRHSTSRR